ncbi:MAG: SUMF1/EgtB/PvdO family nonheme iron enzyme, partial [Verrucomicrobiota bacterium]|nr:SUMF1/EgtB/PvdO family nonheme iron enzyme [Verrucomicrobiota bacterium]
MMKLPVLLLTFVMLLAATSTNADVQGDFEYQANEDGTVAITRYLGSEEEVVIPAALGGKVVTVIEALAFENCESVTRVTIPDSVTSIGDSAFAGCPNLTSVYFKGDAPEAEGDPFFGNDSATVYYLAEATGWGERVAGQPTALRELSNDESLGGTMSLAVGDRIEIEYDDVLAIPDFAKFRMRNVSQHDGNAGILSIQRLPEQRPGVSLQFVAPAVAFLVVEEKSSLQSGEETWRSRLGFAHLDPLEPGVEARIFRRPTGIDSAPWTELTQLSGTGGLVQWVDPEFSGTDDYSIILERPGGVSRVFQPDVDNFLMIEDPDSPIYGLEMDISAGSLSAESIVVINPGDRSPVSETMVSDFELTILPIGESMQRRSLGSMAGRVQIALKGAAKKAVDFFVQINEEYGPRLSVEIPYMKGDPCYWECSPVRNLPLITGKIGTDYVLFEWDIADTPAREVNKYVFWIGNEFCRGNQQDPKLVSCPDDGLSAFASGERNLLLIHGIRAARDTFLEAGRYGLPEDTSQGLVQWALGPGGYDHVLIYEYPSFHSIDENGDLLWSIIQRNRNLIPSNARFDIIAHSMGGMVARAFLRSGGRQVDHLVTLGTPHQGTTLFSTVVSVIDASPTALREALAVAPTTPIASLVPSVYWQYWMYAYIGASVADEVLSDEWFNELVARFVPGAADFLLGSEFLEEVNDPVLACPLYEIFYISGDVAGHSSGAACFLDQGADCLFTIEETRLPETIPGLTDSAIMVGAGFSHTELPRSLYQRDENGQTIDQLLRTWLGPDPATNPVSIEMVPIPGGTFQMGDEWGDGYSDEGPVHSVTLSPFSLSKYEVTNEQMREVMQWAYDRGKVTATSS